MSSVRRGRTAMATLAAIGAVLLAVHTGVWPQGQAVNVLCSTDQGWCELAAKEFQAATGIRVLQTHKATGESLAQLRAEGQNPKTDLWWGGTGDPYLQAAEAGLLDAYRPEYLGDLHGWAVRQYAMSGNRVGGFYTSAIGFGWNEEVLRKKKLPAPKCWADLADPKYKGEIETSHPVPAAPATPSWPAWCN